MNKCAKCYLDLSLSRNIFVLNNNQYCEDCYHKITLENQKKCFRELNHLPSDYGEDNKLDNFGTVVQSVIHKVEKGNK